MKKILSILLTINCSLSFAQTKTDTAKRLNEVIIKPYFSSQSLLRSTGSIGLIDQGTIEKQPSNSLVSAINTISGVRMEERSPGSYRLSIRGSLLRSPFGIRNVKIYFDDFPLTDAGGNSYLNALDIAGAGQLQILKGPHGSIFGANSGGVILIQPQDIPDSTLATVKLEGGSFGSFHQTTFINKQFNKYTLGITQAYQRSDGYRDHSGMGRKYFQLQQKWDYAKYANLKSLIFYSDLHYNTPGGLTAAQLLTKPEGSRTATLATKSAIEQRAGIYNKTLYGGISNSWAISEHFKHVIALFSSYTDFKNPFITNYEKRKEFTLGLRSYLEYSNKSDAANLRFNVGVESMQTSTDFNNYNNNFGIQGAVQASDRLKAKSNFAFAHLSADIAQKLLIELSASANLYGYNYESLAPVAIAKQTKRFSTQLMPRLALSYLFNKELSLRASVSKGYSPPTLSEVRASNNVTNVDLQPEKGWNYETGVRVKAMQNRIYADLTGFYYHLKNAIVRRVDENVTEYFVNAGGTKQWGLETSLSYWILTERNTGFLKGLQLKNSYTLSKFKFDKYLNNSDNYSGNSLTGVPKVSVVTSLEARLPKSIYLFAQHNYTSSIPLNDANTVFAHKYHLLQAKAGIKNFRLGSLPLEIFAGADNLLNQKYSLGNDLNAIGGRYFNAAAIRSFYGGLVIKIQ